MKFTLAYEGDTSSLSLSYDRTEQDNVPPFAQLVYAIPNWSTAFGVGASAAAGGLRVAPIELFQSTDRQSVAHINVNTSETSEVEGTSLTFTQDTSIGTIKAIIAKRETLWTCLLYTSDAADE